MSLQLAKDKRCFVCGVENPHSLKVKVEQDGANRVMAEFVADDRYRGWSDYLHGGILSLIFDEMLGKLAVFARRNSVRACTIFGITLVSAEVLARIGVFGDKNEGLWALFRESDRFKGGVQERALQKTSSFMLDRGMGALRVFKRFGSKSKFAISVSVGAMVGQGIIQITTLAVRTVLVSFFVLETLSFLGVIGEQGESILDWVDDQRDGGSQWAINLKRWHKKARGKMNFQLVEEFYKAAVDEEKIAAFGFALGTVVGLLT